MLLIALMGCSEGQNPQSTEENGVETREFQPEGMTCTYFEEEIHDNRFGGFIEANDDEKLPFGSLGALVAYIKENPDLDKDDPNIWVMDYNSGRNAVRLDDAYFFRTELINSPCGLKMFAYSKDKDLEENFEVAYGGGKIDWNEVEERVERGLEENWAAREE